MLVLVFSVAAFACIVLTPLVVRATTHFGLYDVPADNRRVHQRPIPRLGGTAVFAAVMLSLLVARSMEGRLPYTSEGDHLLTGILIGGGMLFALGLLDDLYSLRPVVKFAVQIAAALIIYRIGFRVETLSFGPGLEFSLGMASLPVTVAWIVGVTNAFNLIDGLDGLATGIALVALATVLVVAVVLGNAPVVLVTVALIGALLGFLWFNFSPAQIFLGDSGSLFIGFMLAVLSVYGSVKGATAVVVAVPLFALAVPLLDVGVAIGRRWLRGVPVSVADARHIHHRLLDLGLDHGRAAMVLYATATALAILGLALTFAPAVAVFKIAGGGALMILALFAYGMRRLDYHEFAAAGSVVATGFLRIRRVIRDQIHAKDLSQRVLHTASLGQLQRVLLEASEEFGFTGIEIGVDTHVEGVSLPSAVGTVRAWKFEYPLSPCEPDGFDGYVLRIWCSVQMGHRPFGAERVARILAPILERHLENLPTGELLVRQPRPEAVGALPPPGDVPRERSMLLADAYP